MNHHPPQNPYGSYPPQGPPPNHSGSYPPQSQPPKKPSSALKIIGIIAAIAVFLGIGFAYNAYKNHRSDTSAAPSTTTTASGAASPDSNPAGQSPSTEPSTSDHSSGTEGTERPSGQRGANDFAVGDCFSQPGKTKFDPDFPRVNLTDCDDSNALLQAISIKKKPSDKSCIDTAGGVTTLLSPDGSVLCLGEKNVDPDTTINLARIGDCVKEAPGKNNSEIEKVDCSDPKGHEIIAIIDKGPERNESLSQEHFRFCDEAGAANAAYFFALYVPIPQPSGDQRFDVRTFCAS